jgi:hypothetical protein
MRIVVRVRFFKSSCGGFLDAEDVHLAEDISSCLPQCRNRDGGAHKDYGRRIDRRQRQGINVKQNRVVGGRARALRQRSFRRAARFCVVAALV